MLKQNKKTEHKPFFVEGNGCEDTQLDSVNDQEPVIGRMGKEVSALSTVTCSKIYWLKYHVFERKTAQTYFASSPGTG